MDVYRGITVMTTVVLQRNLDRVWKWNCRWQVEFNFRRSKKMESGKSIRKDTCDCKMKKRDYQQRYRGMGCEREIFNDLLPEKHKNKLTGKF